MERTNDLKYVLDYQTGETLTKEVIDVMDLYNINKDIAKIVVHFVKLSPEAYNTLVRLWNAYAKTTKSSCWHDHWDYPFLNHMLNRKTPLSTDELTRVFAHIIDNFKNACRPKYGAAKHDPSCANWSCQRQLQLKGRLTGFCARVYCQECMLAIASERKHATDLVVDGAYRPSEDGTWKKVLIQFDWSGNDANLSSALMRDVRQMVLELDDSIPNIVTFWRYILSQSGWHSHYRLIG